MSRERLGSRLGFILLSAGCAIGVGNVWRFPSMAGAHGGGIFVLFYLIFLVLLGLPVMTIEFSLGRASQKSPIYMCRELEKPGQKWHWHGKGALVANCLLMMFYTSVTGWFFYYFYKFISGDMTKLAAGVTEKFGEISQSVEATKALSEKVDGVFGGMVGSTLITVAVVALVVILGFLILSFGLEKGVERVTKVMMSALIVLMVVLAVNSFTMSGAKEGLAFYLIPDFSKFSAQTIVQAMNQAFFTLSLGIGSMAIFGSYIDKKRSLMGESVNILVLDTFVAITAGLIIFPACTTYGVSTEGGPNLLFNAMATVFSDMPGGRWWGAVFFLFMIFAAMSTIIAVFQNILAMVRELTGWSIRKGCVICGIALLILSVPCALGFNVWSGFVPFAEGSAVLDLEDFLVSNIALPLGCLCMVLFCVKKNAWGFENFMEEANAGKGLKVKRWMRPYMTYVLPAAIVVLFVIGIVNFPFAGSKAAPFTIWGWLTSLF